jgi:hypothetical protein
MGCNTILQCVNMKRSSFFNHNGKTQNVVDRRPLRRVELQHRCNDRFQLLAVDRRERGIFSSANCDREHFHAGSFEGAGESAEFVEDTAKGPDVALLVVRPILPDLRRNVVGRTLREGRDRKARREGRSVKNGMERCGDTMLVFASSLLL